MTALSNLEIAEFCNQMGMMLGAGISALEALHLLKEDAVSEEERILVEKMIEEVEMSGYFHVGIETVGVFPQYVIHMVKLGEETGTLDVVMHSLEAHYVRESNLKEMFRNALLYPSIMLTMMILIIVVLLTKVMPVFRQVFAQLGQEMSGFSAGLLLVGESLSKYSILFVLVIIVGAVVAYLGRDKLPFRKKIMEKVSACRFADGMSLALKSGLTPEAGLELVENLVEDDVFVQKIEMCKLYLENGENFAEALHKAEIFTGTYARMALLAGKTGVMDDVMGKIAEEYEHSVDTKITGMIAILEPTLVIVLSIIVGVILFSVMLPLLGIMSGL